MTGRAWQAGRLVARRLVAGLLGPWRGSFSRVVGSSRRVAGQEGSQLTVLAEAPGRSGDSSCGRANAVVAGRQQSQAVVAGRMQSWPGECSRQCFRADGTVSLPGGQDSRKLLGGRGECSRKQLCPNARNRGRTQAIDLVRAVQRLPGSRKWSEKSGMQGLPGDRSPRS